MELNEYQHLANRTDQQPKAGDFDSNPRSIMVPLLGMAGEVGELLGEHKKWLRDGDSYRLFPERVKEELGDLLWYLSNVATKHDMKLEEIALFNLSKTGRRWQPLTSAVGQKRLFDENFPPTERLPRQMDISIEGVCGIAITTINGTKFGDSLTDNRYEDDGYRFHDISHLAYASILGWSPTLRALLRRKRKSDPRVDEVEDGGRAIVIEEGISAMVFSYAERRNFLDGTEGVNYDLLRTIKDMTSHLEVNARTEGDWERAIMAGFDIWRQVKAKGKGQIHADLERGTIELVR
ncbi:MAG: nucleotide pyrophosphohydrolase [Dehalococcoidia bacterium]|nr:nucleotide pyrophosphohydrolase [Dehalococcoidia bacterium]